MQFYVHDYLIDYLGGSEVSTEVCCGISVMYSTNKTSSFDEDLQQFLIYAGTPKGMSLYFENYLALLNSANNSNISFFRPIVITKDFDEETMYHFLKKYIESIRGNSEKELLFKIMLNFDWVHDNYMIEDEVSYLLNSRK